MPLRFALRLAPLLLGLVTAATAAAQTLTVWVWGAYGPALESTVAAFRAEHPGVRVTIEDLGNQEAYDRALAGCAAGGRGLPDVYLLEPNEAQVFWSRFPGCFRDLRAHGAEELRPRFPAFAWAELTQDGAIHAIPFTSGPTAIFYRRDLYRRAGIDPGGIATWADFAEAGRRLEGALGGEVRMATVGKGVDDEWFRMLATQADCFYFADDGAAVAVHQPGCVRALETLKMLWDAGALHRGGWVEQIRLLQDDRAAGAFFGSWYAGVIQAEAPEQSGQWGAYETPGLEPGGVRASNLGGTALAVPSSSAHPELAWAFVRHALTDPERLIAALRDYGLTPSLLAVQEHPYVDEGVPFFGGQPIWRLLLDSLDEVPPVVGTRHFQAAREVMIAVVDDYLDGAYGSAEEALGHAASLISEATGLPVAR